MAKYRAGDKVILRKNGKEYEIGHVLEPTMDCLPVYYDLKGTQIYAKECELRMAHLSAVRIDGQIYIGDGR